MPKRLEVSFLVRMSVDVGQFRRRGKRRRIELVENGSFEIVNDKGKRSAFSSGWRTATSRSL